MRGRYRLNSKYSVLHWTKSEYSNTEKAKDPITGMYYCVKEYTSSTSTPLDEPFKATAWGNTLGFTSTISEAKEMCEEVTKERINAILQECRIIKRRNKYTQK